jgi:hypothetical protein
MIRAWRGGGVSRVEAAFGVVQRPALGDREDGDMLGQPGVLQI